MLLDPNLDILYHNKIWALMKASAWIEYTNLFNIFSDLTRG